MADEDGVKEPEVLALPDVQTQPQQVSVFESPYFLALEQEKRNYKAAFENSRRNLRVERIRRIESIRSSKVIVYYSVATLTHQHAEILFDLLQSVGKRENLDLFLLSPGGFIDPAFKMANLCREFAKARFSVIVPHYAKSAATLLCLGSDELVMGPVSEIGPTDPRIEIKDEYGRRLNVSATAVEDALGVIEEIAAGDPVKSLKYMPLIEKINLNTLGEYRRALKSSKQYAEELLKRGKLLKDKAKASDVAEKLAKQYWAHGYPLHAQAAKAELDFQVAEATGELWQSAWQLHKLYDAMIKDSRDAQTMTTTIFEAEEFLMPLNEPLVSYE